MSEQDTRLGILNSILTTPHRDLMPIYKVHEDYVTGDPLFYQRMAAWYCAKGDIRDLKEVFVIHLCLSTFEGHRDLGAALLRKLAPYQVLRVIEFIKFKLGKNVPRTINTEIVRYLDEIAENPSRFDQAVLTMRKAMKNLYRLTHAPQSERVNNILFENNPPEDSPIYVARLIAKTDNPTEQAQLLIDNKIPYTVACSIMKNMTPAVIFALVDSMTPQQLINSMGALKKRGALNNKEIKTLVDEKLKKAKKSKKVVALKGLEAIKNTDLSEDVKEQLVEIADTQIKSKGRIGRPTALFVDKSSSMRESIEIGKQMAAMISSIMKDGVNFFCYAFDGMAFEIKSEGNDIDSWTKAFKGINAQGMTTCAAPLVFMDRQRQAVEQILMITDEGNNGSPAFLKALQAYAAGQNLALPSVTILRCGNRGSWGHISDVLARNGVEVETYEFSGDYYSLPNLIHFLTKPSRLDLLMEIMSYDLPKRQIPVSTVAV